MEQPSDEAAEPAGLDVENVRERLEGLRLKVSKGEALTAEEAGWLTTVLGETLDALTEFVAQSIEGALGEAPAPGGG